MRQMRKGLKRQFPSVVPLLLSLVGFHVPGRSFRPFLTKSFHIVRTGSCPSSHTCSSTWTFHRAVCPKLSAKRWKKLIPHRSLWWPWTTFTVSWGRPLGLFTTRATGAWGLCCLRVTDQVSILYHQVGLDLNSLPDLLRSSILSPWVQPYRVCWSQWRRPNPYATYWGYRPRAQTQS